ncbi:carbonic anhydrase [Roseomonas terrae]|jgi:carbonic anhydrase|uniref:Carbonic anhydrase n=1 Tax=Neoroseomonas terrae TaxID=424799 RepID=A0ABS5EDG9_9PROT|nr:carbonic anhydrase [Neoroseomonas terrae]MBR0649066.1 carbonic anhydrase [Neoroseomonas terrae]
MDELIAGYRRFRAETWPQQRARFEELAAQGQRPHTMIIACSDSRVDPQSIFSAGPGELFVLRNVANLVPPYMPDQLFHGTSAAVEFAVRVLKVDRIVVMGHALCGGISALLHGAPPEVQDFVAGWIGIAERARTVALRCDVPEQRQEVAEHEAVRISLDNLMTFPWVASAVAEGRLSLHGAHFGVATGRLVLVPAKGEPTIP